MSAELLTGRAGASAEGLLTPAAALLADERTPLEVCDRPIIILVTSLYGSSSANNGKDALNSPDATVE
eukprot:4643434-Pyramimonas_sp.AAC.1